MKGLLLLYRRIQKLYDRHMDDIRKSFSLSRIEITIISFLHNNPGLDTAGDIAEYRNVFRTRRTEDAFICPSPRMPQKLSARSMK